MLNEKYDIWSVENNIDDMSVAYRKNKQSQSNIHFAANAISKIFESKSSIVFVGDFENYFDTLDHFFLKKRLMSVLKVDQLTKDWYNVFKSVTKFGYLSKEKLEQEETGAKGAYFHNLQEFREELIGSEPYNLKEFELLLLQKFKSNLNGDAKESLFKIKKQYETNINDVSASNGIITLALNYASNQELNDFLMIKYGRFIHLNITEEKLLFDLLQWYTTLGTIPMLKHYWYLKQTKYPDLLEATWKDPIYLSKSQYKSVYTEMTNNSNILNFQDLNNIIKVKYRDIIENIDAMTLDKDTTIEDYVMKFLTLWKILQVDLPTDKRIRYFWNEFFMRNIMGSSFKDYFYDPILELFLEYWFPAETTTQNKDVFTILIKDKMNMIVTDSKTYSSWRINRTSSLLSKDQFKITITKKDGTIKEHSHLFSKTKENKINVLIDSNLIESTHIED